MFNNLYVKNKVFGVQLIFQSYLLTLLSIYITFYYLIKIKMYI